MLRVIDSSSGNLSSRHHRQQDDGFRVHRRHHKVIDVVRNHERAFTEARDDGGEIFCSEELIIRVKTWAMCIFFSTTPLSVGGERIQTNTIRITSEGKNYGGVAPDAQVLMVIVVLEGSGLFRIVQVNRETLYVDFPEWRRQVHRSISGKSMSYNIVK